MSDYLIDEDFDYFLQNFGQPDWQQPAPASTLEQYQGRLPDKLLYYWQRMGFCRFQQGLFWMVNPADFVDVLKLWLSEEIRQQDNYHVIARNGFGKLYVWGEKTGDAYEITPSKGWVYEENSDAKDIAKGLADKYLGYFFSFKELKNVDMIDNNSKPLFARCVKKFGALAYDEMFGFVPAIAISNNISIKDVDKMNLFVHLNILPELIPIQVLDFNGLGKIAYGIEDSSHLLDLD